MLIHGVTITLVPWLLDSSELIYGRRSRPLPGQERAGRPFDPAVDEHVRSRAALEPRRALTSGGAREARPAPGCAPA